MLTIKQEGNARKEFKMKKYYTADRQTGTHIDEFNTYAEAEKAIQEYEEAEAFIEKYDGSYNDHAVRFYDYSGATQTAKITEYEKKIAELMKARTNYIAEHSVRTFQAKYIGCSKCGSKINKDYLRAERCSICGTDLRSKTTLNKIEWYGIKIEELHNQIETEKKKQKNKAKIKWLIKYEYHC